MVIWEANDPSGTALYGGARRVFAQTAEQAREFARRDIAQELQRPPESIEILQVRRLEP